MQQIKIGEIYDMYEVTGRWLYRVKITKVTPYSTIGRCLKSDLLSFHVGAEGFWGNGSLILWKEKGEFVLNKKETIKEILDKTHI